MLWCTGLGSNSLTGSPKRSTNGCATYTYRCHPLLTTNPGQFWGRPLQFLFVIGLDAGQLGYSLKTEGNELASTAVIDFEIACLKQSSEIRCLCAPHPLISQRVGQD